MASLYSSLEHLIQLKFHVKHRRLAASQKLKGQLGGQQHAIRKGQGMDFNEVRPYQAGDDVRHIDWRVSARTQQVHTKVFTEEHEKPVLFILEQTSHLFFGSTKRFKTVQAANLFACLSWAGLNQKERVGGLIFDDNQFHWQPPKHHAKQLLPFLNKLISFQTKLRSPALPTGERWLDSLIHLQSLYVPGCRLFLIGNFSELNTAHFAQLRFLKKRNDVLLIHVFDDIETRLPNLQQANFTNGIDEISYTITQDKQLKDYQSSYEDRIDQIQQQLNQLAIPFLKISAQADPTQALIQAAVLK